MCQRERMADVSVTMTLADWHLIDGGMDNIGELNREHWSTASDAEKAARADEIRRRGWKVSAPLEQPLVDAGVWPPDSTTFDRRVTITLDETDWELIASDLRSDSTPSSSTGAADPQSADRLADLIDAALRDLRS